MYTSVHINVMKLLVSLETRQAIEIFVSNMTVNIDLLSKTFHLGKKSMK